MSDHSKNAAVLWTGGKDCALAYYKGLEEGYKITHLVTFTPENPNFVAHSLHLMDQQVNAIGLPHLKILVQKPMKESYENGIQVLKDTYHINTLITGDIDEVENHSNWIEDCCQKSGMNVFNPLWKKNREDLIQELIHLNFNAIFTLTNKPFFNPDWIGRQIDHQTLKELRKLGIDICGENGEYHTMVIDAPFFKHRINLAPYKVEETEQYYFLKYSFSD